MMENAIVVQDLRKRFGEVTALDGAGSESHPTCTTPRAKSIGRSTCCDPTAPLRQCRRSADALLRPRVFRCPIYIEDSIATRMRARLRGDHLSLPTLHESLRVHANGIWARVLSSSRRRG
jgi:hypothetical protein